MDAPSPEQKKTAVESFAVRHSLVIAFVTFALCLAGIYSALKLPSSVFPLTNFPRVVILVNNGIMPVDEMMATVTRPIEDVLKSIPGATTVRSSTERGAAEINVFFDWKVDMVQSELYVLGKMAEISGELPPTATTEVSRVTFSAFPILGISLTSPTRDLSSLWDTANYDLKPRFLQIPGISAVELVGGRKPEYHVIIDSARLRGSGLVLSDVTAALTNNNLIAAAGMLQANYHLYLTTVDGRVHSADDIGNLVVSAPHGIPVRVKDVARVDRGEEPVFEEVTAEGRNAVLLNILSHPNGSTLDIAKALKAQLAELRHILPPDMKLAFFYDQSLFVKDSVGSAWEAIFFGIILSVIILFCFLKHWGTTLTAITVIPVTVLITILAMSVAGLTFNVMTLGGIAAAIGLVIDDAIVVVEAIHVKMAAGFDRFQAIQLGLREIWRPLLASTLTPVVVFIPLAFLDGITGVFFRALAMTMVVSLLVSLALAFTFTPTLVSWFTKENAQPEKNEGAGFILRRAYVVYERGVRVALRYRWLTALACLLILALGVILFQRLESNFLPDFDEGAFVIDFVAPPGTSLVESSRQLDQAEAMLRENPNVESYSRRLGTQLGLFITEPYIGDFLVKLKPDRRQSTDDVIADLRHAFNEKIPAVQWEFPGVLSDLVGDLALTPDPIAVKIFSPDLDWLKATAPHVEDVIKSVRGVVDTRDGLVETGPSINVRVRPADAARFGLTADDIATAANIAMLGQISSHVLEGDRAVDIRVVGNSNLVQQVSAIQELTVRGADGAVVRVGQVADVVEEPSEVELDRDDLRQDITVTGRLENRDLGSAMKEIQDKLSHDKSIPAGTIEYGGLYQQQQESFKSLLVVLVMAILLVFTVLMMEFGTFYEPISIVFGAILSLFGSIAALWVTHTSLNIVSYLGAIIGVGIVAKNGILMLDHVDQLCAGGMSLEDALVQSGHRRLRPVLMTSLAAALGMMPLAWGVGSGAEMLRPLAIAVIGALCVSVLLSLVATPTVYYLLVRRKDARNKSAAAT